jgi:hypothetical protein
LSATCDYNKAIPFIAKGNKEIGGKNMAKEKHIIVVILEPEKPARVETIENTLANLQKIVGGYIECVREEGFDIIINEEGKLLQLQPNFLIYGGDYIAGTAIFAGVDYNEGEFKSLTDEQIEFILSVFPRNKPLDSVNILGELEKGN